jgi:hypothetical protein
VFRVSITSLNEKPDVVIKAKDQDFAIGKTLHYKFSADASFEITKQQKDSFFFQYYLPK